MRIKLMNLSEIESEKVYNFSGDSYDILLIKQRNRFRIFENKCPHFGVKLEGALIAQMTITCKEHGIKFDLESGIQLNRFYDECDQLKIYKPIVIDEVLYADIS